MKQYLLSTDALRRIRQCFNKGVVRYNLLEDGDNILVALSGGKDSLAMLDLLAERSRIFKPRFTVVALHVVMRNVDYISDVEYLRDRCDRLGVPFYCEETSFEEDATSRKPHCFLCSWYRRKVLFRKAQELHCNKIALGHHIDDILCTLLMNMTFAGQHSTMLPRLAMNKFAVTLIRPLCLVNESDIADYARTQNYPQQIRKCPYEDKTRRKAMMDVLRTLEMINPEARYSLWNAASHQEAFPPKTSSPTPPQKGGE